MFEETEVESIHVELVGQGLFEVRVNGTHLGDFPNIDASIRRAYKEIYWNKPARKESKNKRRWCLWVRPAARFGTSTYAMSERYATREAAERVLAKRYPNGRDFPGNEIVVGTVDDGPL